MSDMEVLSGEPKPDVEVWVSEIDGRWVVQIMTYGEHDGQPNIKVDLNDGRIWDAGPVDPDDVQGPKSGNGSPPTMYTELARSARTSGQNHLT